MSENYQSKENHAWNEQAAVRETMSWNFEINDKKKKHCAIKNAYC